MKMLKKLAALILAATMALVLFTACGGDTPSTPEAQAEAQMNEHDQCKAWFGSTAVQ